MKRTVEAYPALSPSSTPRERAEKYTKREHESAHDYADRSQNTGIASKGDPRGVRILVLVLAGAAIRGGCNRDGKFVISFDFIHQIRIVTTCRTCFSPRAIRLLGFIIIPCLLIRLLISPCARIRFQGIDRRDISCERILTEIKEEERKENCKTGIFNSAEIRFERVSITPG
jgi:hypothetical protein